MFCLLSCLSPGRIHTTKLISIHTMTPNASLFSPTADLVDEMLGASWAYLRQDFMSCLSLSLGAVQNQNKLLFHSLAVMSHSRLKGTRCTSFWQLTATIWPSQLIFQIRQRKCKFGWVAVDIWSTDYVKMMHICFVQCQTSLCAAHWPRLTAKENTAYQGKKLKTRRVSACFACCTNIYGVFTIVGVWFVSLSYWHLSPCREFSPRLFTQELFVL